MRHILRFSKPETERSLIKESGFLAALCTPDRRLHSVVADCSGFRTACQHLWWKLFKISKESGSVIQWHVCSERFMATTYCKKVLGWWIEHRSLTAILKKKTSWPKKLHDSKNPKRPITSLQCRLSFAISVNWWHIQLLLAPPGHSLGCLVSTQCDRTRALR